MHQTTNTTVEVEMMELENIIDEMKTKIKDIELLRLRLDQHETKLKTLESVDKNVNEIEHILKNKINHKKFSENDNKLENLEQKVQQLY